MREASKIASQTQKRVEELIRPGISTIELDRAAEKFIRENDAIPAQKNFPHYEKEWRLFQQLYVFQLMML